MREMKDSGFKWIGNIPNDWEIKRIKNFILESVNIKRGAKETDVLSLGVKGVSIKQDLSFGMNPTNYNDHNLVAKGQYVICLRDLDGPLLCGISQYDGCLSALYYVLVLDEENINKVFFNYVMKTMDNTRVIDAYSYGMRHSYNLLQFGNLRIPVPNLSEQKKIAGYLDRKCGEIDSVMADLQEQIDKLEQYKRSVISETVTKGLNPKATMKNSGIEWLGETPVNWTTQKAKYCFCARRSKGNRICLQLLSPTQKFGVIPQSEYEKLTTQVTVKVNEKTELRTFKTIHKGDFCISLRSFEGGFEYSDYEGVVSPAYTVFYPIMETDRRYYKYLFKTKIFIYEMNSYSLSLRDGKPISFDDFGNTFIPVPPLQEQREISDYLDEKCAEIESIIADKKQQLEVVENYKKSLIYEYVTGKKEVVDE